MKTKIYLGLMTLGFNAIAQQNPTGVAPPAFTPNNLPAVHDAVERAWYRGGNFSGGTAGANNIFGTMWNSPIYTQTNAKTRMVINGDRTVGINAYLGQVTDGFIGIGANTAAQGFPFNGTNAGPFSLLHLNSGVGTFVQSFGWRPWMKYGITSTHNQDLAFFGQRQNPSSAPGGYDVTDVVIGWADNGGPGTYGPDNMVFNFLTGGNGGTDDLAGSSINGREIMRLTGYGNVGIGPRFNNTWQPQSTLHQHQENSADSWMQITNQLSGGTASATGPTNITTADGLRWGINGANTGFIYNQENNHLLFSTNNAAGGNFATTGERMRVTHIGAPGTTNPGGVGANTTRVSISHNPIAPVTRPLSLLHLGYNTGGVSATAGATDGWRPWMDIGMFVSNNTDNVYIGLKDEAGTLGDRQDAVLSWGDNQTSGTPAGNGPDNFRFIFTSSTAPSAGGTAPATGANGLEALRMTPTLNSGVYTGVGGAPTFNPYTTGLNPGNTMEINSWGTTPTPGGSSGLRFTNLNTTSPTIANPGQGVLSVNAQGDVIYVPSNGSASFGNICGNTPNPLTNNWEIPLGGKNYVFTGNSLTGDRVGIGVTGCVPIAKLQVENTTGAGGAAIAGVFRNTGVNNSSVGYIGVLGTSNVTGTSLLGNVGGQFNASGAAINNIGAGATGTGGNNAFGVNGNASNGTVWSVAGKFDVINSTSPQNYGINSNMVGGTNTSSTNYGASFYNSNLGITNIGVQGIAFNATNNYAIYGSVNSSSGTTPPTGPNYAGYFNGDVVRTGTDNFTSDQMLKQNIDSIQNAMGIIKQLKPKSYEYKRSSFPSMNLPGGKQYGLIAQDVQMVLPELVNNNTHPAEHDSVGNVITPSFNYLSLEYQQLIGIMLKGMQEQQHKIDSLITKTGKQDSINNAVQQQIAALASQINGCCSNASARHANTANNNQVDVELSDKDAIVLNQNVPNPFAEQTTITYNVPESVGKAQILFYNSAGQIIQTVDVKTRGKGKINVFASDLSSGIYHYTLVADGKVIDSKKMMRE